MNHLFSKDAILITILLCMSAISGIASDMYIAAFPEMSSYFQVTNASIKWTVSLFFIGLASSQLIYGPLSDYIGRKKIIVVGFMIFFIGCIFCVISTTFPLMLLGRFIQGVGAGATTCISRAILRDKYNGAALSKALSYIGMGLAIVPAVAPILGSYVQLYFGWKFEFGIMLAGSAILFFVANIFIPETNLYVSNGKISIKNVALDFKNTLFDPAFFVNVAIASFFTAMIYVFYTATSFYLQNNLHWSEVQFGRISIVIATSLFFGRKFNIVLAKLWTNNQVIFFGCFLALLAAIGMFVCNFLNLNVMITLLLPISIYTLSGGIVFSNTFVGATEKHNKTIGLVSSLYGSTQMTIVFISISLSTLLGIETIESMAILLFATSLISIVLVIFLMKMARRDEGFISEELV